MIVTGNVARALNHLFQRVIIARFWIHTKTIPRGHSVISNLSLADNFFEECKSGAQALPKLYLRDGGQLRLGIVNVIDIDTIEVHVVERLGQLVFEIPRRHAVRATGNVAPRGDAGLDEVLFDVLAHVAWRRSVKRQVTAFRANHEFFPRKTTFPQHLEGRANRSLA